ncbi:MAG: indole-3-glycerol phosphate synthase TrpC [Deltaproteobacteria bacterium]|nr:indole-3-glycerol phosphate synthase TrpC [Deltaproteobacteria bacterium]
MHSRLVEILDEKQREVERLKKKGLPDESQAEGLEIRNFKSALSTPGRTDLIAEIKFASPSAGVIREKSDPLLIGRMYDEAGAAAISLLTDEKFFGGNLQNLTPLKKAVTLPILRKDFIIHEIQVRESLLFGADAILLIVRILSGQQLKDLLAAARESGLAVLTEVHDTADLETAIDCGAEIIGINNRNLDTFEVDVKTTLEIAPLVPDNHVVVSESGIFTGEDIGRVKRCGVQAVLVATSIMKSDNPADKVKELVKAGRD